MERFALSHVPWGSCDQSRRRLGSLRCEILSMTENGTPHIVVIAKVLDAEQGRKGRANDL